jgi:hypothetical protein
MKILIKESQLKFVIEQQSEDLCVADLVDTVNGNLEGIVTLNTDEVYSVYEDPNELLAEVTDPKIKNILQNILNNISRMSLDEMKTELQKVLKIKNTIREQQTPYLDQTIEIAGTQIPKVAVHSIVGLVVISLLSTIIKTLSGKMDSVKSSRRSGSKYIVGCQGARSRAKAVRKRRRRENWERFLKKIGMK